jgi:hypothetical protein
MKKFIVTTTINSPTEATLRFCNMDEWTLIVVGDLKTPHKEYEELDCVYLHPEEQEKYKELSDAIGWKTIQRRNIGFIEAHNLGADIVATVDDDNIPYDNWGQDLLVGQYHDIDMYESKNGVFDPLSVTNNSELWHRGYPVDKIKSKNDVLYLGKKKQKVLIQANLWDGDPDIDASLRLTKQPIVKFDNIKPYGTTCPTPFNSQNTFIHRDVLPYYMVLPYVGRMDDIWGAYLIQHKFGSECIAFCEPTVYQDRNEQDLVTNLQNELIGYRHTQDIIDGLYEFIPEKTRNCYDLYRKEYDR